MEQVIGLAMLGAAVLLLAVLMRSHRRLNAAEALITRARKGQSVHEITISARMATAVITTAGLMKLAILADQNDMAIPVCMVLIPVFAYANAYAWQFRAVLSGSDLTLMTPGFQTRTYDLTRLLDVIEVPVLPYRLRFQGGETAWILRYVYGHSTLRRALLEAQPYY